MPPAGTECTPRDSPAMRYNIARTAAFGERGASFEPMRPSPTQHRFKDIVIKILVHQVSRWKRRDPHEFLHILLAERPNFQTQMPKTSASQTGR